MNITSAARPKGEREGEGKGDAEEEDWRLVVVGLWLVLVGA